jgi:Rrf2 family protein
MILSKSARHAIRALLFIGIHTERDEYYSIRQIADELSIPFHFLTKIFQKLNNARITESAKGVKGGVRLIKPGGGITLLSIVAAVDGASTLEECIIGFPNCDEANPCALHFLWKEPQQTISALVQTTTLSDLVHQENPVKI